MMHPGLQSLLRGLPKGADDIFSSPKSSDLDQSAERSLRERVAGQSYDNYLAAIAQSHSVPVMDHEVDRLLSRVPRDAVILDIGGCWGWHWRRLTEQRPDVGVLIVDFVRANLLHAQCVLGSAVGTQVALLHADATALPFSDGTSSSGFDYAWSVQVFQHIPDFLRACREAHRVLKPGGRLLTYSLHRTPFNRIVYRLLGKHFHLEGMVRNDYYLARASDAHREGIAGVFGGRVIERYTECLFHPDLKVAFTGRVGSLLGRLDARIGSSRRLARLIARQRSFEAVKA